ncbi:MAG: methylated-DNA--[protein]-cysteine S-methyltransferase [Dongiaceae bacterium]
MAEPAADALRLDRLETPIGALLLVADGAGRLQAAEWADAAERLAPVLRRRFATSLDALQPAHDPAGLTGALAAYFAGDLGAIDDLPIGEGGTGFQRRVWAALRGIPAGTTATYGAIAARLGRPAATRAVGHANGANPVSVVVPCHRLVGADGSLTGYGGGLARKRWLLTHEGVRIG